jgi:hypothetical protein
VTANCRNNVGCWPHPHSLLLGAFSGCKEVEHEVGCPPVGDAELKNGGARPPLPHASVVWCLMN